MFLPWLTGGIAALDLFIKDEIEREGHCKNYPDDFPGTKGFNTHYIKAIIQVFPLAL